MASADYRAILAAMVVVAVGLFGEVGWPLVYLCAGVSITVISAGLAVESRLGIRLEDLFWWAVIAWGVAAALMVSGGALESKMTLASWGGAWVIWAAVGQASDRGRRIVSVFLIGGALLLGAAAAAGACGTPRLINNYNISVAMIVSAVPLVLRLFRCQWKARSVVALMLIPVVVTGSRAGVLAVLVIALFLWPAGRSRRWVISLGGLAAVAAIAWRVISHPDSLAWHRWRIWGAVMESIGDRPLWGIGAGSVGEAMGSYRLEHLAEVGRWGHIIGGAENMPLGLALRVGMPGLVLAVTALVVWFVHSRRPAAVTSATLSAIIVMGLFHDFWSEPAVLWWWAAVFGMATLRRKEFSQCQSGDRGSTRWPAALAVGGVVAWALVQPAWAQWLWWHTGPTAETVVMTVRVEPWFSQPMRWRVEDLLAEKHWTWARASESLEWSRRMLEIQPGSAGAWDLRGRVHTRIVEEFGAWPSTVEKARMAFGKASALEPRLPWYPYHRALLERGLGNLEGAKRLALQSVGLEPAFVRGRLLLARLELDGGNPDAARRSLERALASRDAGKVRCWTAYHRDLIRCSEWQLEALDKEFR